MILTFLVATLKSKISEININKNFYLSQCPKYYFKGVYIVNCFSFYIQINLNKIKTSVPHSLQPYFNMIAMCG